MSIVNERMNANKPPPDLKNQKGVANNNKDLDVDVKKEEPSFFGSFFAKSATPKKKGAQAMEAVSILTLRRCQI